MKIAILGPEGTFCDKAYEEYKNSQSGIDLKPEFYPSVDEVFAAVEEGCDLGIVPVENTLDGYVQRTLDLLLEQDVHVIAENRVPVHFSLVGNVSELSEIKKLYVQFKTNGQCRRFIRELSPEKIITTESNMESFYAIGDEPGAAAIVPHHILSKAGDRFIVEDVTDATSNFTRFCVFEKGVIPSDFLTAEAMVPFMRESAGAPSEGLVGMSAFIMPAVDRPGILYMILRNFYENQINLVSIMSRPTKQSLGTYNFYIELQAPTNRLDKMLDTLNQIHVYNDIKVIGVYGDQE